MHQSKRVGTGSQGAAAVTVYEAKMVLLCAGGCMGQIEPGERFTRRGVPGGGSRRLPFCRDCAPFTMADERERSGGAAKTRQP